MTDPTTELDDACGRLSAHHRWIDVLLVTAGLACLPAGRWLAAAGLAAIALGLVVPLRRRVHLPVPPELAAAQRDLLAAASLPGVDGRHVVEASEDALLEVAAVLGGRPPRGAAQRRLVAAHVTAMGDTAAWLREWSEAWLAARAEVEAIEPSVRVGERAPDDRQDGGRLVGVMTVGLAPLFIGWDVLCLLARGVAALVDGVVLRARAAARLAVDGGRGLVALGARARTRWSSMRARAVASLAEARHAFVAARLRVRIRLRSARRGTIVRGDQQLRRHAAPARPRHPASRP